jgi:hypothetical protein
MKSTVSEFGLGFALLLRDVLDDEFIDMATYAVRTHRNSLYSKGKKELNLNTISHRRYQLERRPSESDYCALVPSPHINCCQDAADRGKMGGMSATLENIRVNLPSPEKYRITYWSCSGSRRAISSLHLSTK